mgnify:CR=1 FL=1
MAAYYEGGAGKGLRAAAAAAAAMGMAMNVRDEELLGFPWLRRGKRALQIVLAASRVLDFSAVLKYIYIYIKEKYKREITSYE